MPATLIKDPIHPALFLGIQADDKGTSRFLRSVRLTSAIDSQKPWKMSCAVWRLRLEATGCRSHWPALPDLGNDTGPHPVNEHLLEGTAGHTTKAAGSARLDSGPELLHVGHHHLDDAPPVVVAHTD